MIKAQLDWSKVWISKFWLLEALTDFDSAKSNRAAYDLQRDLQWDSQCDSQGVTIPGDASYVTQWHWLSFTFEEE